MKKIMLAMIEKRIEEKYNVRCYKRKGKIDKETDMFHFEMATVSNNKIEFSLYAGFVSTTGTVFITYIDGMYLGKDNFEKI